MDTYNNFLNIGGGGNSDYNIIRTPSKAEFDNLVINSDLNGTLNSDLNTRKINVWNCIYCYGTYVDFSTFQDNTNNTSTRLSQHRTYGSSYANYDKDFYVTIDDGWTTISANFRPIIEYRE